MGRHGTIAGRKAAQDSKRAAMFTKYAKAITVAAKDGGDPDYNASLRLAIEKAKAISMPNDNIQRAINSSVRSTFDKYGGNLGTPGCVSYMFNSKGVLVIDNEDGDLDEDTVMDAALEAGADDMVNEGDSFVIYTDPADFADVLSGMKEAGYEFVEADIEKVPTMEATPKPEDLKRLSKMLNLLEENEDVQKVHHNCAVELLDE